MGIRSRLDVCRSVKRSTMKPVMRGRGGQYIAVLTMTN